MLSTDSAVHCKCLPQKHGGTILATLLLETSQRFVYMEGHDLLYRMGYIEWDVPVLIPSICAQRPENPGDQLEMNPCMISCVSDMMFTIYDIIVFISCVVSCA